MYQELCTVILYVLNIEIDCEIVICLFAFWVDQSNKNCTALLLPPAKGACQEGGGNTVDIE